MIWLIIPIVLIIGYVFSIIKLKNENDMWLLPHHWFLNVVHAVGILWSVIFGRLLPKGEGGTSGDSQFMELKDHMVKEALDYANERMTEEGIVYPDAYLSRSFDCENFAFTKKVFMDLYISRNYGIKGKGVPVRVIGYDKDSGVGHAIVSVDIEGVTKYTDVYPSSGKFYGYDLTVPEISSIRPIYNG
jgi:hypothetical protein